MDALGLTPIELVDKLGSCVLWLYEFSAMIHIVLYENTGQIFLPQVMEETRNLISIHKIINRCQAISSVNNEECVKKSQD